MNDNQIIKNDTKNIKKKKSHTFMNVTLGAAWGLLGMSALATSQTSTAHAAQATITASVPVVCHMSAVSSSSNATTYTVDLNTLCNTMHSANIDLSGSDSQALAAASFSYNGQPVALSGNTLPLYSGSPPKRGQATLVISGLTTAAQIQMQPQIIPQ